MQDNQNSQDFNPSRQPDYNSGKQSDFYGVYSGKKLGSGQKIAIAALGFMGILVIIAWFTQFNKNLQFTIKDPNSSGAGGNIGACTGPNCGTSEEALKSKDTDGDGLSDYDELKVHMTSPYLEDSDSDGMDDKAELDAKSDPNCPLGKECGTGDFLLEADAEIEESLLGDILGSSLPSVTQTQPEAQDVSEEDLKELEKILSGQISASELRQMLIQTGGIDKKYLDQLSDEQLLESYKKALEENVPEQ